MKKEQLFDALEGVNPEYITEMARPVKKAKILPMVIGIAAGVLVTFLGGFALLSSGVMTGHKASEANYADLSGKTGVDEIEHENVESNEIQGVSTASKSAEFETTAQSGVMYGFPAVGTVTMSIDGVTYMNTEKIANLAVPENEKKEITLSNGTKTEYTVQNDLIYVWLSENWVYFEKN